MSDSLKKIGNWLSNTAPECELQSVLACFKDARWELENNFSLGKFFIFQKAATKIEMLDPQDTQRACFYQDSFLDDRFALDPSDYSIAVALALKMKHLGRLERAKQILQRVADSGYPERKFAQQTLRAINATKINP